MMVVRHHFVAFSFLFRLLFLLLQQYRAIEASDKIEDVDLYSRVSKIEAKDLHQDGEISLLKNALNDERRLVYDLTNRVAILEDPDKISGRPKRPVRLLPPHILR